MLFLFADGLFVLLFLAAYAARYVHPKYLWWMQLIAIGLPYLSMIVLGATVCLATGGFRRLLVLHLVLCLVIVVRFIPTARFGGPRTAASAAPEENLKVMTFNIWPKHRQIENWRATSDLFQAEQPHLAALQEMPAWFSATEFMESSDEVPQDTTQFYVTALEVPSNCKSSQVVLSRIEFDKEEAIPSAMRSDDCTHVVRVRLRWQGQEIAIYSVHLRSFQQKPWRDFTMKWWEIGYWSSRSRTLKSDFIARAQEAEELGALLNKEKVPVILCGDFNSTPHNWVYQYLRKNLVDAFEAAGRGWGGTYHAKVPLTRIDFIFVSPEWHVVSARVHDVGLSDHRPLVAQLLLRNDSKRSSAVRIRQSAAVGKPQGLGNHDTFTGMTFNGPYRYPLEGRTGNDRESSYLNAMEPVISAAKPDIIGLHPFSSREPAPGGIEARKSVH